MTIFLDVKLSKSTINMLRAHVDDFGLSIDDVVRKVLDENKHLKSILENQEKRSSQIDTYCYKDYVIHKQPKGKILVTKDEHKVGNMKKVLIEAGKDAGMDERELDPNFTTYEIGRFLFRHLGN